MEIDDDAFQALAMAAAWVLSLRKRDGYSEKDALETVAKDHDLAAKDIENFIDYEQRGKLNRLAQEYYQSAVDTVSLRHAWLRASPETRAGVVPDTELSSVAAHQRSDTGKPAIRSAAFGNILAK